MQKALREGAAASHEGAKDTPTAGLLFISLGGLFIFVLGLNKPASLEGLLLWLCHILLCTAWTQENDFLSDIWNGIPEQTLTEVSGPDVNQLFAFT